jgi:hypothetical protein
VGLQWDKQPASRVTKTQTLAYTKAVPAYPRLGFAWSDLKRAIGFGKRIRWMKNAAKSTASSASGPSRSKRTGKIISVTIEMYLDTAILFQ